MSFDEEFKEIAETLKREAEEAYSLAGISSGRDGISSVKSKEAFRRYNQKLIELNKKYNRPTQKYSSQ